MADPMAHVSVDTASEQSGSPVLQEAQLPTTTVEADKLETTSSAYSVPVTPTDSTLSSASTTAALLPKPGRLAGLRSLLKHRVQQRREPVWRPSMFALRPLLGLLALALSIACMLVSLAILVASNKQPVKNWSIQPTVYLAIAAALANVALGFARYIAGPLSLHYTMSRGTSLRDLERQWEAGHSVILALRHRFRMGFTGFATLLAAVMIIDGPLLQRATNVKVESHSENVTLALTLAQEVPGGFSGYWRQSNVYAFARATHVENDWSAESPITLDVQTCNDTCTTTVRAPGVVQADCESTIWPITNAMWYDENATWGNWRGYDAYKDQYGNPFFYVKVYPNDTDAAARWQKPEGVRLLVGRMALEAMADGNLTGSYNLTECHYKPAVLEYDVKLNGKEVILGRSRLVAAANNTAPERTSDPAADPPDTMGELTTFLNQFVGINNSVTIEAHPEPGSQWAFDTSPSGNAAELVKYLNNTDLACNLRDPTDDIIASLNELLFRAAVAASGWDNLTTLIDAGLPLQQSLQARQTITQNVYRSDLRWFAGAAILEGLAALFVLPLLWGFWKLDKVGLLSPLEVAKLFDAPLLAEANSAAGARGVVDTLGDREVKLGAVRSGSEGAYRFGVAESQQVYEPHKGMRFDV
ncbi:hypothetical protein LTR53_013158 [Teratosphaeriaceae sp. CCFEE 6253]|nr:hypothetical protein LTR53_013158 [Teratosphaeriaceae sp. CCFEE 6253]